VAALSTWAFLDLSFCPKMTGFLGISRERVDIFDFGKDQISSGGDPRLVVTGFLPQLQPVFLHRFLNFSPGNGTDFERTIIF
jgi:hypothetical protein